MGKKKKPNLDRLETRRSYREAQRRKKKPKTPALCPHGHEYHVPCVSEVTNG